MSGNPDVPVSNGLPRLLNHTYHAAHQIKLDLIDLVNGHFPKHLWSLFDHLSGPRGFRITVPNERNLLDSKHLIAAHQIRLDLVDLVNGHLLELL